MKLDNDFILDFASDQQLCFTYRDVDRPLVIGDKLIRIKHKIAFTVINIFNKILPGVHLQFKDHLYNKFFGLEKSVHCNIIGSGMTNVEQIINIYHLLLNVCMRDVDGEIVELGCNEGVTSVIITKALKQFNSNKRLHVYDSFEGLPKKLQKDGDTKYQEGQLSTTKQKLIDNFNHFNAELPVIHQGWFDVTLPNELPDKISFAHLDGDLYASIYTSLEYVYPKLTKGAIVVIDDYCDPDKLHIHNILPGVKAACDDFFKNKMETISVLLAGSQAHGFFIKQ